MRAAPPGARTRPEMDDTRIAHFFSSSRKECCPMTTAGSHLSLKKILVPIDFSEYSKKALRYAFRFAEQFSASLTLLYVVEPTVYPADFSFG
ncbi:MAG: universal stress protein, partial [Acidobacteriota bacterium]